MRIKRIFFWSLIILCLMADGFKVCAEDAWLDLKGKHFIIYYNFKEDTRAAQRILNKAEEYYVKIASRIGYSRYADFWTWEERVKIIIFPDQATYVRNTGQPAWSRGYANRDSELFKSRIIVSYRQENGFLEGILPHEISHLILRDFLGTNTHIPIWFDEGVAQLEEADKKAIADRYLRLLLYKGQPHIPFSVLFNWDIRSEQDETKVTIFYTESVSLVDFMIGKYGSTAFGNLCRNLKSGKSFEDALRKAYPSSAASIADLERKWLQHMGK